MQAEGCLVSLIYSGVITFILLILVEKTVGFRMGETEEMAGLDHSEHAERGYGLLNLNS